MCNTFEYNAITATCIVSKWNYFYSAFDFLRIYDFYMTIIIVGSTLLDTILLGFEMYFWRFYIFRSLDKTSFGPGHISEILYV